MSRSGCGLHASGQRTSPVQVLIALLLLLQPCEAHKAERFLQDLPEYEVVHPTRVNARGHFLSNFLSHHSRRVQRREASDERADPERVFYRFGHAGRSLHFNLTLNPHLLAPGFLTERRYGGLDGARIRPLGTPRCHFLGEVWDEAAVRGSAAVSACDGLIGLFKLSDEEFFIQPLETASEYTSVPQAHAIYKRHVPPPPPPPLPPAPPSSWSPVVQPISGRQAANETCGVKSSDWEEVARQRERWERRQQRRRRRLRQRSVSKEKWVETLVVADSKMVDYHGSKAVESYVLAVMNIVAGLYKDASIGNAINVVIVRLILLEKDEDDLKITHHADNSLNSFCKWQKKLNMKGDDHPLHHDVAVLLTRKDICTSINVPCETLGLSHVAGMCQPHRSCSISEDTGLPLAFTVAHEMGHNFGIQHDGRGNDCEPIGKRPFVMSPQLLYGTALPRWSRCSRQYITRFLDRGWGWCLDDAPVKDRLSQTSVPPGVLYSAMHQCQLQYGSGSRLCDDMDNVCSTLWCTMGTTCHSKLDGAVDGTSCGNNKWCFGGECVVVGYRPDSVHGGWGSWSEWSACSRSCGAGTRSAERDCDNPVPKFRGRYCLGERRRYRTCSTEACTQDGPSFRDMQCSHFNTLPYKGKLYRWEAVINRVNPCELHCRPLNEHFSEKMRDAVTDGTPCYEGNKNRDMCINGICKRIGCDYVIDSTAVEDRCGVCHGNGSTCRTVRRTFEEHEGLGYVDIGLIPEGAWDIRIQEVAEAGNFLALRSDDPNRYFLNGGWTIQWTGDYKAAGTVFTYERSGHLENLTSPGPTMEPLWVQLLFQEKNPGVRYEYTISRNISEDGGGGSATMFVWKYGSWTECSATCGTGVHRQIVHCVEKTTGIVEERFCDPSTQPHNNQTNCNKDPCPARWWVGQWQKCSSSCGSSGLTNRAVLCVQAVSEDEQEALDPSDCQHIPKPESVSSCNTHISCPADWTTSTWSKCSLTCGSGVRQRNVTCSRNTGVDCDPLKRPLPVAPCYLKDCPQVVDNFGSVDWSGSGWSSKEVLNEIKPVTHAKPPPKHGGAKAQPRSHNHVVEGDFHYHNNLEDFDDSRENRVQVDDFYYDYNFINFHEDLSNNFEGEEKDSEGGRTAGTPREAEATRSEEEPTGAPTASPEPAGATVEAEKHQNTKADDMKENANAEMNYPAGSSEDLYDFLAEDHLLPVITTRSPPLSSTTRHSHAVEGKQGDLRRPENISTAPHLVFTSNPPAQDVKPDLHEDETHNNDSSEEENHAGDVTVTLTPRHQTTMGSTAVSAPQIEEHDDYTYDSQEDTESPGHLDSTTTSETMIQVETEVQLEETTSATPQTDTQSTASPFTVTLEDQTHLTGLYLWSEGTSRGTDSDLSAPSPPTRLPSLISGNVEASGGSAATTGTGITPPTDPQGVSAQPPPDVHWPVPVKNLPADAAGTDSSSEPPDFDYNEIVVPPMLRSRINLHSGATSQFPTSTDASPRVRTTPAWHPEPPSPAVPGSPTDPAIQWSRPVPTSLQAPVAGAAYWVAGNWSACSTTCGLGATWRALMCSTGSDLDCDPAKRPVPAQRCYLRPCATWKVGEWSMCSRSCDSSIRSREVQCFDLRDHRPLRPFHCLAVSSRPPTQTPCNPQPCLQWYTSSWGQCSEVCGGGEQQRIVTCPEDDRCDSDLQPTNIQPCNIQPCAQWLSGSWGQCSAPCGGGVQHRLVQCVDTKTDKDLEAAQCDGELQPESAQKCNIQECESAPSVCLRDRLTVRFCHTLRWLGRCRLPNVQAQCCKTCSLRARPSTASTLHRGHQPHQVTTHMPHRQER